VIFINPKYIFSILLTENNLQFLNKMPVITWKSIAPAKAEFQQPSELAHCHMPHTLPEVVLSLLIRVALRGRDALMMHISMVDKQERSINHFLISPEA
jgi:hypothetical protein